MKLSVTLTITLPDGTPTGPLETAMYNAGVAAKNTANTNATLAPAPKTLSWDQNTIIPT